MKNTCKKSINNVVTLCKKLLRHFFFCIFSDFKMDFDMNPGLEIMEDVKVKVDSPELVDFNPWAVSDASVFLRYCCPECSFQSSVLSQFSEHALSVHHDKAKTLFSDQEQGSKVFHGTDGKRGQGDQSKMLHGDFVENWRGGQRGL